MASAQAANGKADSAQGFGQTIYSSDENPADVNKNMIYSGCNE
jgi:hypothetical protein